MLQRICSLSLLSLLFITGAFAEVVYTNVPTLQYLTSSRLFNGDRHSDFRNDFVAILGDGSQWKIHPKDTNLFKTWEVNDVVHIRARTSFFWFKREHKFEMYNHTRNEIARVMLIQYPYAPLIILSEQTYLKNSELVPMKKRDADGNEITEYTLVNTYEKVIYLNDGSSWIIKEKIENFTPNKYVYLGVNDAREGLYFFLITGTEREAVMAWITN
jgi:hypothetical protein